MDKDQIIEELEYKYKKACDMLQLLNGKNALDKLELSIMRHKTDKLLEIRDEEEFIKTLAEYR